MPGLEYDITEIASLNIPFAIAAQGNLEVARIDIVVIKHDNNEKSLYRTYDHDDYASLVDDLGAISQAFSSGAPKNTLKAIVSSARARKFESLKHRS